MVRLLGFVRDESIAFQDRFVGGVLIEIAERRVVEASAVEEVDHFETG